MVIWVTVLSLLAKLTIFNALTGAVKLMGTKISVLDAAGAQTDTSLFWVLHISLVVFCICHL